MKKALKILLAMTIIGSLFAVGFAGNAAAYDRGGDVQANGQVAVSHVDQTQTVEQTNWNEQKNNVAVSASGSIFGGSESGDAVAIQANAQSNRNSQVAVSNAQNFASQEQD